MEVNEEQIKASYKLKDTEEIEKLLAAGTLTELAVNIASQELRSRGISDEIVSNLKHDALAKSNQEIGKVDFEKRLLYTSFVIYGIAAFIIVVGFYSTPPLIPIAVGLLVAILAFLMQKTKNPIFAYILFGGQLAYLVSLFYAVMLGRQGIGLILLIFIIASFASTVSAIKTTHALRASKSMEVRQ